MLIKILLILILTTSCGKDVNVSSAKMKERSEQDAYSYTETKAMGVLTRGKPDKINTGTGIYPVSVYSSHAALEFIAGKPMNTQMNIKYKGVIKNQEIVLSIIEAQ